ncbi:MAG TPA: ISL3 family transposase [Planctomycetaceae bacterium]|nr:ISL3 family transposase [Planctomycetaceae bacterium]
MAKKSVELYFVVMDALAEHYRILLGLDTSWKVDEVDLDLESERVVIRVSHGGGALSCSECHKECSGYDLSPERVWRHLDTMQFTTEIRAQVPRCKCVTCGVKTVSVPWAEKHSRFTLMFEAFAIKVLSAASSVQRAAVLLGLSWDAVHAIMERGVERGLSRRDLEGITHVGIDEKSFGRGHDYVSLMTDLGSNRVLDVVPDRTTEACDKLWETLTETQRNTIQGVSMDMWKAFMKSTAAYVPNALVVHDKFHISKHLNEAVDKVRRSENKQLRADGDDRLVGTKQLWLFNELNLDETRHSELMAAMRSDLKTGRAWAIKENFRNFWNYCYGGAAKSFFESWYAWAIRSRLQPIKNVARMLKTHLPVACSPKTDP